MNAAPWPWKEWTVALSFNDAKNDVHCIFLHRGDTLDCLTIAAGIASLGSTFVALCGGGTVWEFYAPLNVTMREIRRAPLDMMPNTLRLIRGGQAPLAGELLGSIPLDDEEG